ncbi:MAG TPA: NDP-sugar synthase [Candidatus Bathyarchaeia archaeon]|nr:NDP-sugar synthase [Candidatus Bathyarchaeia archaeon]
MLAGGYATRLRPISYVIPKLLFPVLGKPMIYWTFDLLKKFGVDEVVLCVNYLADLLQEKIGSSYRSMKIIYSSENEPLGTAGPLRLAAETVRLNQTFLAMNGDVIAQVPLSKMLNSHESANALVTDALHEVKDPSRFGVAELCPNGRIKRFIEKPQPGETSSRLINAGIYLIEPEILDMISLGQKVSLEKQIFPILSKLGRLAGFSFDGLWFDIGNFEDYCNANFTLLQNCRGKSFDKDSAPSRRSKITDLVYVGESTRIGQNVALGPLTVIGRKCVVERNSRVSKSVLFDDVIVGEESLISGSILASNVKLGKRVTINPGCILSPNVTIGDDVKVGRGVIIHPYKEITANLKSRAHVL